MSGALIKNSHYDQWPFKSPRFSVNICIFNDYSLNFRNNSKKGHTFWITLVRKFDLFISKNEVRGNYRENNYYLIDTTLCV